MFSECIWQGKGDEDRSTMQGLQTNEGDPVEVPGMDLLPSLSLHVTRESPGIPLPWLIGLLISSVPQFICNVG